MFKLFKKNLIISYIMGFILIFSYLVYSKDVPENKKVDVLRFDAILELNSQNIGTNVTLFARYWVAPDFYSISINWAEPYIGRMNFPTDPIGLSINSDDSKFSINNQFIQNENVSFEKPLNERGIFQHSLNNYPFDNIRFAEGEAISTRIYKDDLDNKYEPGNSDWQTLDVNNAIHVTNTRRRNLSKADIKISNGKINDLIIFDNNGIALKGIRYEYYDSDGNPLLKKKNVLLFENRLMVGFIGKGATITFNGGTQTYKELPGYHHVGGRNCTVDYKTKQFGNDNVSVPYNITVQNVANNSTLRGAKLLNYVSLKMSEKEIEIESEQYGKCSEAELNLKKLYEKYWLKNNENISNEDANNISILREEFENKNRNIEAGSISENLKYMSYLMQLDYLENKNILGDFTQYLNALKKNNLKNTLLYNGIQIIGLTAQWNRIGEAEELLSEWNKYINDICSPDEVFEFCVNQQRERYYWITNCLLDSYLSKNNTLGEKRFDIEAFRVIILNDICEIIEGKSKTKTPIAKSQIEWALKSANIKDIQKIMNDSLNESIQMFSVLKEPTGRQITLKNKLEQISKQVNN